MSTSSNPIVQASQATMTSGGFPPAGTVYEFINTDRNNALYFIDSNGNFSPVNDMGADCCACRITEKFMCSIGNALEMGLMTPTQYEVAVALGISVVATEVPTTSGGNTCTVSIGVLSAFVTSVTMTGKITTFTHPGTAQLGVTIAPVNGFPIVLWVSSNNTIATVDNLGLVNFLTSGTVTITVYSIQNPTKFDSTTIVVS